MRRTLHQLEHILFDSLDLRNPHHPEYLISLTDYMLVKMIHDHHKKINTPETENGPWKIIKVSVVCHNTDTGSENCTVISDLTPLDIQRSLQWMRSRGWNHMINVKYVKEGKECLTIVAAMTEH